MRPPNASYLGHRIEPTFWEYEVPNIPKLKKIIILITFLYEVPGNSLQLWCHEVLSRATGVGPERAKTTGRTFLELTG